MSLNQIGVEFLPRNSPRFFMRRWYLTNGNVFKNDEADAGRFWGLNIGECCYGNWTRRVLRTLGAAKLANGFGGRCELPKVL
ncbi:hypothetical protein, partial [Rhodopirellula sallentina]|uniref:hypothetical protein n=1 Tax=Rhodopirellula sallentina TaxID=1263869 RepID=UPI001F20523F